MFKVLVNKKLAELDAIEYSTQLKMESVEVLLLNLLALQNRENTAFIIPFDDVLVTIRTAIEILND